MSPSHWSITAVPGLKEIAHSRKPTQSRRQEEKALACASAWFHTHQNSWETQHTLEKKKKRDFPASPSRTILARDFQVLPVTACRDFTVKSPPLSNNSPKGLSWFSLQGKPGSPGLETDRNLSGIYDLFYSLLPNPGRVDKIPKPYGWHEKK